MDLSFEGEFNVFLGDNGVGKTNLLEGMFLLATLKSFRGAINRELMREGSGSTEIEGEVSQGGLERRYSLMIHGSSGKKARMDGKAPRTLGEYFTGIKAVCFTPEDVVAIAGPPSGRRSLLDRGVFDLDPSYLALARAYGGALAQRTELLKSPRGVDGLLFSTWTERLAELGSRVLSKRLAFLHRFEKRFQKVHGEITGVPAEGINLRYRTFLPVSTEGDVSVEALKEVLFAALLEREKEEKRRKQTLVGPHRDDFMVAREGVDLRVFGSRGQVRAAALALKMAQVEMIRDEVGIRPLFLLDDWGSELDQERGGRLLQRLKRMGSQVFMTATDSLHIQLPPQEWMEYRVFPGRCQLAKDLPEGGGGV